MNKICSKCGIEFEANCKGRVCKTCKSAYFKQYYNDNGDAIRAKSIKYHYDNRERVIVKMKESYRDNKEQRAAKMKIYQEENKEQIASYYRKYRELNKERLKNYSKEYSKINEKRLKIKSREYGKANRDRINKQLVLRAHTDPQFRLRKILRSRLNKALKSQNATKTCSAVGDLGCNISFLKNYLESKFYHNPITGEVMSWDNYGPSGWHIDHIKPLSSFDLTDPEQQKLACHYTNLQPLWAFENLSKGDRVDVGP